jgi:hypothetical protein
MKVKTIDSVRMDLIKENWHKSKESFLESLSYSDLENEKDINIGSKDEYKINFPIESFPLRFGMEQFVKIKDFKTYVHLGYSENNHIYGVSFIAEIEEKDGIISNPNDYKYEYMVWIKDKSIVKIRLIDTYKLIIEEK